MSIQADPNEFGGEARARQRRNQGSRSRHRRSLSRRRRPGHHRGPRQPRAHRRCQVRPGRPDNGGDLGKKTGFQTGSNSRAKIDRRIARVLSAMGAACSHFSPNLPKLFAFLMRLFSRCYADRSPHTKKIVQRGLTSTYVPSRSETLYGFSFFFKCLSSESVSMRRAPTEKYRQPQNAALPPEKPLLCRMLEKKCRRGLMCP